MSFVKIACVYFLFPNFAPEMKFLNHILRLPYFSTYYISNTCSDRLYTYVKLI